MSSAVLVKYHWLMPKLGPFPTLSRTSCFLGEHVFETWRRVELGQLQTVRGTSVVRIRLESIAALLCDCDWLARRPRKSKKQNSQPEEATAK
jgi:hypothetical protein